MRREMSKQNSRGTGRGEEKPKRANIDAPQLPSLLPPPRPAPTRLPPAPPSGIVEGQQPVQKRARGGKTPAAAGGASVRSQSSRYWSTVMSPESSASSSQSAPPPPPVLPPVPVQLPQPSLPPPPLSQDPYLPIPPSSSAQGSSSRSTAPVVESPFHSNALTQIAKPPRQEGGPSGSASRPASGRRSLFECSHCQKKFERVGHLQEHVDSVHAKLKRHECPICHSRFAHGSSMRRHMSKGHPRQ